MTHQKPTSPSTESQMSLNLFLANPRSSVLKQPKDFPELEILWLLTRAWNTGILLYSLAQYPEAERWCGLGMSFLRHLGSLQDSYQTQVTQQGVGGGHERSAAGWTFHPGRWISFSCFGLCRVFFLSPRVWLLVLKCVVGNASWIYYSSIINSVSRVPGKTQDNRLKHFTLVC